MLLIIIDIFFITTTITALSIKSVVKNKKPMSIIAWIILGGIAGWIGSMIMGTDASQGLFLNIIVGIIGAIVGGFVFNSLGEGGVSGFNLYSLIVATIGSIILLWLIGLMRSARR